MKIQRPEFLPSEASDRNEMEEMQKQITREANFSDSYSFEKEDELTVVGVDQAFTEEKSVSAAVAMEEGELVEEVYGAEETPIPYIPGLLAFREGSSIVSALEKLKKDPDLLLLDGSGRIHYRQAGIATHIGVIFDIPAIGVAKNLLCGEVDLPEEMEEGEKRAVYADEELQNLEEGKIGYAYQSRQFSSSRKINPIYVSPGHRVNEETSVELVEKFCEGYKLPEPVRTADKKVTKLKQNF